MSDSHRVIESPFRPDVTVATVICRDQRFLLVEETVRGMRVLNQPAGHLEADESLIDAARRETLEETAWEIEPVAYLGTYQWTAADGSAFLRFAFVAEATMHHPQRALDVGIEQTVWMTRDEIAAAHERLRSPLVLRVIDDYLAGIRLPLSALRWVQS